MTGVKCGNDALSFGLTKCGAYAEYDPQMGTVALINGKYPKDFPYIYLLIADMKRQALCTEEKSSVSLECRIPFDIWTHFGLSYLLVWSIDRSDLDGGWLVGW